MRGWLADLDERVRREVASIALVAAAVLSYVALYGDGTGWVGGFLQRVLLSLFGRGGAAVVPALVGAGGLALFLGRGGRNLPARLLGTALAVTALLIVQSRELPVTTAAVAVRNGLAHHGGGIIGGLLNWLLVRAFGAVGRDLITLALVLLAVPLTLNVSLGRAAAAALSRARRLGAGWARALRDFLFEIEEVPAQEGPRSRPEPAEPVSDFAAIEGPRVVHAADAEPAGPEAGRDAAGGPRRRILGLFGPARRGVDPAVGANGHNGRPGAGEGAAVAAPDPEAPALAGSDVPGAAPGAGGSDPPAAERQGEAAARRDDAAPAGEARPYRLPPITLLQRGRPAPATRSQKEAEAKARQLEVTLENFGVKARVVGVQQGPAVTRFELEPATGVRVSKIQSLANDIALSLAAPDVRIEAPIPGKSLVGIEVPNREISAVYLRDVIDTREFKESPSRLTVAIGKDIAGQPVVTSLEKMLHVLIAGATGSGKSVCVNALLGSLLFKARPDEVKLLLIDPKVVELSAYNGIPHLLVPVVTEPKRAAAALAWLVREMERRYERFADAGVRDIGRFNAQAKASGQERLPYIVVVIDELADLMMVAPVDVEDAIQRLAQMARAAGIHLVVATQRPSVDVITGVIKANIPSRIAFAVSSQTDSRVILDMAGAEKLVGKGDMLFYPMGASKPIRVQGAYLSENELEALLAFIRAQGVPQYREEVLAAAERGDGEPLEGDDDLFPEAVRLVVEAGQASVSLLQRRLRVGYTRAGRLIDMMEERGFVGPHQGSKPRDVRITMEEYRRIFQSDA